MKTRTTYARLPVRMSRKRYGYSLSDASKGIEGEQYVPGQSKLAGYPGKLRQASSANTIITEEQLVKIRLLLRFGKSIKELALLFEVPESEIRRYC